MSGPFLVFGFTVQHHAARPRARKRMRLFARKGLTNTGYHIARPPHRDTAHLQSQHRTSLA
eukprot:3834662-Rhodomonas_salina.2